MELEPISKMIAELALQSDWLRRNDNVCSQGFARSADGSKTYRMFVGTGEHADLIMQLLNLADSGRGVAHAIHLLREAGYQEAKPPEAPRADE